MTDYPRRPSLFEISAAVCRVYRIGFGDLCGSGRTRELIEAREVYIYLARELTIHAYTTASAHLGKASHSARLESMQRAVARYRADSEFRAKVERAREILRDKGATP